MIMQKDVKTKLKILFIIRVCLWITAFVSTIRWMSYSIQLNKQEIFDPYEFAVRFRPVFYPCFVIAAAAIGLSFALYAYGKRISRKKEDE